MNKSGRLMGDEISGNRKKVNRTHLLVIPSAILIAFSVGSLQAQESTEATSSLLDKFRDVSSGFYDKTKEALDDVFESDYTQLTQKSIVGLNNPEIKEKIDSLRIHVDALMSLKEKEIKADTFTIISKSKKDYRIKINSVLIELEKILFDGEIVNYSSKIRMEREQIKEFRLEIADLNEDLVFASNKDTIFKKGKEEIKEEIGSLEKAISLSEEAISKLEFDLKKKLHLLGIKLSSEQIRVLTTRVDGDEVSRTFAVFDITRQISEKLKELVKKNAFESSVSVKYYGIYVILSEVLKHSQQVHLSRINDVYVPALGRVEEDINDSIEFATKASLSVESADNKFILEKNIESNQMALKVVSRYRELLLVQEKHLVSAIKKTEEQIMVAYSTYDTAANSANLVMLIDKSQAEFDRLVGLQLPEIVPFETIELTEKFGEISDKISQVVKMEN
tara:strand:- start:280 stop:1626 length:1347 start_codon:yes stop_codon:yes gene_type:complete